MYKPNQCSRGTLHTKPVPFPSVYRISIVVSALALLCCFGRVRADDQVPFHGTFTSMDWVTFPPPGSCLLTVVQNGEGEATHVGQFTWTPTTITPDSCASPVIQGYVDDVILTAANGDQLFGTATLAATGVSDPPRVVGEGTLTITGGTGRFAHSTGTMRWSVVVNTFEATPLPDGTVLVPAFYTLEGTISSVGANKK